MNLITQPTPFLILAAAIALMFFGRKLFPVFIGALGFTLGFTVARDLLGQADDNTILLASLLIGVFGIILAITVQKIAVTVGGFLAGSLIAYQTCYAFMPNNPWIWGIVLVAGIAGVIAMIVLFDMFLVIGTAAFGSSLAVSLLPVTPVLHLILLVLCGLIGAAFQFKMLRKTSRGQRLIQTK